MLSMPQEPKEAEGRIIKGSGSSEAPLRSSGGSHGYAVVGRVRASLRDGCSWAPAALHRELRKPSHAGDRRTPSSPGPLKHN